MTETVRSSGTPSRIVARGIIAGVVGLWLSWQVCVAGIGALAARSGDMRLLTATGSPAQPQAGSLLARQLLAAGRFADAAALARSIVLVDPFNDRALRVLGLASEKLGKPDTGAAIMRQAAKLGWRDTPTQLWMLNDAALHDDAVTVIQRADALARRNRSGELVRTIFLAAITEPRLRSAFIDSLGNQPMWRGAFFADVRQRLPESSIASMEALFRELRADGQTISPIERLSYVDRLVDLGRFDRARRFWAISFGIAPDQLSTSPYDPDFTLAAARPADAPTSRFEWVLNPDLAGSVTFDGAGLTIPAALVGETMVMSQVVILSPGTHALSAQVVGPAGAAAAGWSITCLPSGQELPRRLARGADDELSAVSFDVPSDGCGAQKLGLLSRDRLDAQVVTIGKVRIR